MERSGHPGGRSESLEHLSGGNMGSRGNSAYLRRPSSRKLNSESLNDLLDLEAEFRSLTSACSLREEDLLDGKRRENSARYGRRAVSATPSTTPSASTPRDDPLEDEFLRGQTKTTKPAAREAKRGSQTSLEESWISLSAFNQLQRGRISIDMRDDVLDLYLSEGTTEARDSAEGFVIPELPKGVHLTVDIKSTWGDRHYVGLNGIEVFGETGEPLRADK
ncbi:unnamed protein product, partial [Darwinula stevensoni]